ncbi:MAG: mannitol dehydrogenase family protein [Mangrovicoccus sp.]|nr:mannitol dehydrogenase family protein [Mangrovicoccus sp.]
MTGVLVQFGTSRFLQAHVDLFLHEARASGQDVPDIVVVQTSGAADRAGRVAAFGNPEGFPVIVRGLENGVPVDREIRVKSVRRGLSTATDWGKICRLFVEEATFVVSNTGDRGYAIAGRPDLAADAPDAAFPGKLGQLLFRRWSAGRPGLTVLPCELINDNGRVLSGLIRELAAGLDPAFGEWLDREVIFADTLVDRIVSEPIDPVGAVAEPYALWAIEDRPGLTLPCRHPAILCTASIETPERLKLHILNLGHTVLAQIWLDERRAPDETVRAILADPKPRRRLDAIYRDEVLPGFAAHGLGAEAAAYVDITMARFLNPYLDHRLADIAGNHQEKIERRIGAFLDWSGAAAPTLRAIAARAKVAT